MSRWKIKTLFIAFLAYGVLCGGSVGGVGITIVNQCARDEINIYPLFGTIGWPECELFGGGKKHIIRNGNTDIFVHDSFLYGSTYTKCHYTVETTNVGDRPVGYVPAGSTVLCKPAQTITGAAICACEKL